MVETVYELIQELSKYNADDKVGVLVIADEHLKSNVVCGVLKVDEYVSPNGKRLAKIVAEL